MTLPVLRVEPYTPAHHDGWNAFVATSKNGTFLFDRDYLEYHADRFVDSSLLVLNDKGGVVALLPASLEECVLTSHGGLTY